MKRARNRDNKTGVLLELFLACVFSAIFGLSSPLAASPDSQASTSKDGGSGTMTTTEYYFVRLIGTRDGWPEDMTDDEQKVMENHFVYLKDLVHKNKVVCAGPVMDPVFGLIILQVSSEEEAKEIMEDEPSVVSGVHTYELHPMHLSLLMEHRSARRYVDNPTDRLLEKSVEVSASLPDVWNAWTTVEGVNSFFSSDADIDLRVGGKYEVYFLMDAPKGSRGSEDCKVLSFLPMRMLSFEWNAPPSFGDLRYTKTRVVITFDKKADDTTAVTLSHLGWGAGDDWDELYNYFDQAWASVLKSLSDHFSEVWDD